MQKVPQISQALWDALGALTQRPNTLVELYANTALPTDDGFDPSDAVLRIADAELSFLGNSYSRYLEEGGIQNIHRTITPRFNTVSINLTNPEEPPNSKNRPIAAFLLNNPIEGMFCVIRLISRAVTASTLADSFVAFTGKCEKPYDSQKATISISAKQYIGSTEEEIPWRTFSPEDELGREPDDPLFEGFIYSAKTGSVAYRERVRRGGFLGMLGFKKTVTNTLQFTNHQGVEIDKVVPLILGRAQVQFNPVAYIDAGGQINVIYNASEGPIKTFFDLRCITSGFRFASVADNNPEVDQFRYGYPGGTNGQVPFLNNLTGGIPGNGYYSMSAMMSTAFYGTEVSEDDPAPETIAVILGMLVSLPDAAGDFDLTDWSDNPAFLTRWALTHSRVFNLNPAFINDPVCIKTACYCDAPVLDLTDGERILLQNSENGKYGVLYRRYHSTGLFTPEYFKHYFLNQGQDPLPELTLPTAEFYDPSGGVPTLTPLKKVRRRFTANIYLKEKMKSPDFLFKVLLPTFRGYLVQDARGKLDIRCKRPADRTLIRSAAIATDTEIAVQSILPWVADLSGSVIVGNDLLTSEIREVTGTRYTSIANNVSLAVTGNLTASGATLTGGDNDNPATGSVTVTGLGTLTVTIDGHAVSYTTVAADTTSTVAAMLTQFLKADPTLNPYLKFTWTPDTPTVISIESKMGFLELSSALQNTHGLAQEVLRIQMAFSDTGATHTDLAAANILQHSFGWPIGSRQSSVNRIDGKFIDSPQDFKAQGLISRDQDHIDQTGKKLTEEMTLTGVDSFSQAKRLEMSNLAELRDLDFFTQHTADRRAMLLEEGDLIANTHASGGFRNVALRVEEVSLDLSRMTVTIIARRYSTSAYSDEAPARKVPLPTTLTWADALPGQPTNLTLTQQNTTQGTSVISGSFDFAAYMGAQRARVFYRLEGSTDWTDAGLTVVPDSNNEGHFQIAGLPAGTYEVKVVPENINGLGPESDIETITTEVIGGSGSGVSPDGVSSGYEEFIRNFYLGALAREPTGGELSTELALLIEAVGGRQWYWAAAQIGLRLFTSAEYIARSRTNAQFVDDCYLAYLQRSGDMQGIADWLTAITGGMTRAQVAFNFGDSTEFRVVHAFRVYGWRPENHWEPMVELRSTDDETANLPLYDTIMDVPVILFDTDGNILTEEVAN